MTAKDRFTIKVSCPKCQTSGVAHVWQEDGWSFMNGDRSTHIDSVPAGFSARETDGPVVFTCKKCGGEAVS